MIGVDSRLISKLEFRKCRKKPIVVKASQIPEDFEVESLEGVLTGRAGDYLMIGVEGEPYPCKKEIFEKTYDWEE